MSGNIATFIYEAFDEAKPVRVVMRDGKPWFVVKDICAILCITNSSMAVESLDDDEKGVSLTDTLGGEQNLLMVSESGLYTLILRSRQAVSKGSPAHKFRRWVTGELLPQIRHEGRFGPADPTAEWDWQIIREKIITVRETRLTFGKKAAAVMWGRLGLPETSERQEKETKTNQGIDFVQQFLSDCTEEYGAGQVQASVMKAAFDAWALAHKYPAMTDTAFGRCMTALDAKRRDSGRLRFYLGLKLKHISHRPGDGGVLHE